jgi:hypothetical protein
MAFIFLYLYILDKYLNIISNDKIKFEFSTFTQITKLCLPTVSAIKIQGISPVDEWLFRSKNNLHLYIIASLHLKIEDKSSKSRPISTIQIESL